MNWDKLYKTTLDVMFWIVVAVLCGVVDCLFALFGAMIAWGLRAYLV